MKTARRITTLAILISALTFAKWAPAQDVAVPAATEPVLQAIPDDALGFVLVKNLTQTDKAISKLGAMVQAPVPSVLSMFKLQAGIQKGLDENGSAAIALLPAATEETNEKHPPATLPVVLLPVTDYKKFIAQFQPDDAAAETTGVRIAGHALVAGHKGSFALFTLPDHRERLAKVIASKKGVDSLLDSDESWIGRHQLSIVAMPSGSKLLFRMGAERMKDLGTILSRLQPGQQSSQVVMAFEMYESFFTKASQEVSVFAVGIHLDDHSNVSIDSHATLASGGDWASAMKDVKSVNGDRFAGIPAAPFVFAGQGMLPPQWIDGFAEFSGKYVAQMVKAGGQEIDEQQLKKYVEATRLTMKGLRSISLVMSQPKPGGSVCDGLVELFKVDSASEFLRQYEKSINEISEISKEQKALPVKFSEVKKIEIDGHAGLAIGIDLSGMIAAQKNPATEKVFPALFGPSGTLSMKIVEADEHTVVATVGSEEHAKEALAAAKSPESNLASDAGVAATLKLLPAHAQWIGLVSLKGYMDFVIDIMSAVSPNMSPKLPELPQTAPLGFAAEAVHGHAIFHGQPLGFAPETENYGLETQLVVPAETIVSMSKFVRKTMADEARTKTIETKKAP